MSKVPFKFSIGTELSVLIENGNTYHIFCDKDRYPAHDMNAVDNPFNVVLFKPSDEKGENLVVMETPQMLAPFEDTIFSPIVYIIDAFDNFLGVIGNSEISRFK